MYIHYCVCLYIVETLNDFGCINFATMKHSAHTRGWDAYLVWRYNGVPIYESSEQLQPSHTVQPCCPLVPYGVRGPDDLTISYEQLPQLIRVSVETILHHAGVFTCLVTCTTKNNPMAKQLLLQTRASCLPNITTL